MLSLRDPVHRPVRVVVAGVSGVGKSTLTRRISDVLDLPSPVAVSRVVRRTIIRRRTQLELANGNTEPGMWHALVNREGIIRWVLAHQRSYLRSVPIATREHSHLQFVRLRSQRAVEEWLAGPLAKSC